MKYEIRQIDAWGNALDGFVWNESIKIGEFSTQAKNENRAFLAALKKQGISFQRGAIRIADDGEILQLEDRKTGCPILAAIPLY